MRHGQIRSICYILWKRTQVILAIELNRMEWKKMHGMEWKGMERKKKC